MLSVPELVILAAALDVPPVALVYPNLPDGEVERIPGEFETAAAAAVWFSGESDDDFRRLPDRLSGENNTLTQLLRLSRMREGNIFRAERQEDTISKLRARGREAGHARVDYERMIRDIEMILRTVPGAVVTEWVGPFGGNYELDDDDA